MESINYYCFEKNILQMISIADNTLKLCMTVVIASSVVRGWMTLFENLVMPLDVPTRNIRAGLNPEIVLGPFKRCALHCHVRAFFRKVGCYD